MCHTHCGRLAGEQFPDEEGYCANEDGERCECDRVTEQVCRASCKMLREGMPKEAEADLRMYQ